VKLTSHLHLAPKLGLGGAILPLSPVTSKICLIKHKGNFTPVQQRSINCFSLQQAVSFFLLSTDRVQTIQIIATFIVKRRRDTLTVSVLVISAIWRVRQSSLGLPL